MKILAQSSWRAVNKNIAKIVGVESALLLSDLCDKYIYFEHRGELIDKDGIKYFYNTSEHIEDSTTLSYKKQKRCIKKLEEHGLIKTKLMGVPAKLHFAICENKILQMVNSSIAETAKLDLPKGKTNNNKEIIIENNIVSKDTSAIAQVSDGFEKIDSPKQDCLLETIPPAPLPEYVPKPVTLEIDNVIETIKNACKQNGVAYFPGKNERRFSKFLMSKKFRKGIKDCGFEGKLSDFINIIIQASSKMKYGTPINNAVKIYYNRADVINRTKQKFTEKKKVYDFTSK